MKAVEKVCPLKQYYVVPKKSALQGAISQIQDQTWERINLALLNNAKESGIEKGNMLRIDSTVTETHIHDPTDSSLLWGTLTPFFTFKCFTSLMVK